MHDPWDAPKQGPGPWRRRSFFELMGKKALSRNVLKGAVDGAHLQLTFISLDNTCRPQKPQCLPPAVIFTSASVGDWLHMAPLLKQTLTRPLEEPWLVGV